MKQDKFKKMITSGERMEEKRKNIEKELLEEELDLEELNKMNEDKLDSDEEEVNKLIGKKYTRNEIEQLFLLAEIESSGEIEEKEKNLAYDEDANQNSKKSIKSTESNESEEDIPYMDKVDSYQRRIGLTFHHVPHGMFGSKKLLSFWRSSYARRKFQLNAGG